MIKFKYQSKYTRAAKSIICMSGSGRKCEYSLQGGNVRICGKGDVQGIYLNVLNVLYSDVPEQYSDRQKSTHSGPTSTANKKRPLNDGSRRKCDFYIKRQCFDLYQHPISIEQIEFNLYTKN